MFPKLVIPFQASSPTDSALDFMKRKRLNQLAAKQKAEHSALGGGMQS